MTSYFIYPYYSVLLSLRFLPTMLPTVKAGPVDLSALSNVQKLIHLAVRYDAVQTDKVRAELTRARLRAYNDEISIQARRTGCSRTGELETGPALKQLNAISKDDAAAYAKSYNTDLAKAIIQIKEDVPRANRHTYAARLRQWEGQRVEAKAGPLAGWVEASARSLGFEHFVKHNGLEGTATLEPTTAVCPVCLGWIARGKVSLKVAGNNPPPYHHGCPHGWLSEPAKVDDCAELWTG